MAFPSAAGNYVYEPSKAAAILFLVLYAISLVTHLFFVIRGRAGWMWPMIVAATLETVGFVFKYLSITHFHTRYFWSISEVCVVVSPAFLAASNYMTVGRMIAYAGNEYSVVSHTAVTKIFVISDVISIIGQAAGVAILAAGKASPSGLKAARGILMGALVFQLISMIIFNGIAANFHMRARRGLGAKLSMISTLFIAFYISTVLIYIRSIYRTVEFAEVDFSRPPKLKYIDLHEWLPYVFDYAPIWLAISVFCAVHPTQYLPREKGERIDGTYEETGGHWWSRQPKRAVHGGSHPIASSSSFSMAPMAESRA